MVRNPFADEQVTVAISGETGGFQNAIGAAADGLRSIKGLAGGASAALAALGVGGFAAATKSAAAFEEAMVGVERVTSEETAATLNDELREMAEVAPIAQSELAGIAETAGRLGIEGASSIREFTRVVAEMSTATDLTSDQAADAFARLTELTSLSTDQVRELDSALNSVSNSFATSSSEIVDSMLRSSAALSSLGVQVEDQISLSVAINEVSESAERAGTRMKRLAQELQNPKRVEAFAEALGVTQQEFQRLVDESPTQVIQRLAQTMSQGGQRADILRENLSSVSRQALSALSKNLESVEGAQGKVNNEFQDAESLTKEFQTASSTFNSEVQRTRNALRNVAIETGERTLPALTDLLGGIRGGIQAFGDFNEATDGLAGSLGLAAAAIGGTGAAVALFATGPIGLAAAAVAALAAAVTADFAGIRTSGGRLAEDLGGTLSRSFTRLSNSALGSMGDILPEWYGFETALAQGIDTIVTGIATMVDVSATGFEILLQSMRDAGKAAKAIATGDFQRATEIATDSVENTREDTEALIERVRQRGVRSQRRAARRRGGGVGVPQTPDTGGDEGPQTPDTGGDALDNAFDESLPDALDDAIDESGVEEPFSELGSSAQQAAEQLSTSEQIISDAERNARKFRELGLEDRAKEQKDRAANVRELSRSMQRSVVKDQLESGKSPDEIFGGGNGGGAGDAVAAGSGAGGGASGSSPPAWTSKLNTTLGSLQSSIEKLTATAVVADAVEQAIDGATLSLSGTLELEDDVATLDDVDARIKQDAQQNGRRVRDLGIGNIR